MNRILRMLLTFLFVILLVGCGNQKDTKKEEINAFIENNSYGMIVTKLDECIQKIVMFPSKDIEKEFIYYLQGIDEHKDKFSEEELLNIYNKVNVGYNFSFNDIGFSNDDFDKIISNLRK